MNQKPRKHKKPGLPETRSNRGCKGIDEDALVLRLYMDENLPLGLNNKELAMYLNISEDSFYQFKKTNQEFSEALSFYTGKSTVEVIKALKKSACGFNFTETKREARKDKESGGYKLVVVEEVDRYVPPNPTAATFWVKNKASHHFKDKIEQDIKLEGTMENITFVIKGKDK